MIRDEVEAALAQTGAQYPTAWIEAGLHSHVGKLRTAVQQELDRAAAEGFRRMLLAFGACGNMIHGLATRSLEVVLPDADDCVTVLLYPGQAGKEAGVYYLTRGWTSCGHTLWNERERLAARYGEKKAARLMEQMYSGYTQLTLINTGAYPLAEILPASLARAGHYGWRHTVAQGSFTWLAQLLTGPWDEKFLRFGPGETIDGEALLLRPPAHGAAGGCGAPPNPAAERCTQCSVTA
jgi:hypothetical protein